MKPKDAIKLKDVAIISREKCPTEEKLPENDLYRYLLLIDEKNEDQRKRATDNVWSRKTFRLSKIVEKTGNRVMYYLSDGLEKTFVKEELILIP